MSDKWPLYTVIIITVLQLAFITIDVWLSLSKRKGEVESSDGQ